MTNDEPGVPNTDPETIDPAGHMADLIESGAVDMELAADADRLLDELAISKKRISSTWSTSTTADRGISTASRRWPVRCAASRPSALSAVG